MGRFQQLRAKALSLRGAVALGGALVMVASMTQVASTLAAPDEVREAKAGIATQNYYPTPLTADVRCTTNPAPTWYNHASRRAEVSWDAVPGATGYRLELVDWGSDGEGTTVVRTINVDADTTSVGGITAVIGGTRYQLWPRVRTLNGPAVSSGYTTSAQRMSYKDLATSRTECENTSNPSFANETWENQPDWDTGVIPFGAGPGPSIVGGQVDEGAAEEHLESLPENDELTSPDEATSEAAPNTSETATSPPSSKPISTTPSSSTTSESATTSAVGRTTAPSTSVPTTTSSPSRTTSSAVTSPATLASAPSSTSSAPPSMRARVGDDPIAVGTSQARLEDVDGETQLIVTRSGSEVCTAEVDGASRIESAEGALTVTISGRSTLVDLETCDLT